MVRAKFRVSKIDRTEGTRSKRDATGNVVKGVRGIDATEPCEMQTIVLVPVYDSHDPSQKTLTIWEPGPYDEIRLGTVNLDAARYFELGAEYFVDFTNVPAAMDPSKSSVTNRAL